MDELGALYNKHKDGYATADAIISLQSIYYYITFLGCFTFFLPVLSNSRYSVAKLEQFAIDSRYTI